MGWLEQGTKFSLFFIWSIKYADKTDFVQIITNLSNNTENPL